MLVCKLSILLYSVTRCSLTAAGLNMQHSSLAGCSESFSKDLHLPIVFQDLGAYMCGWYSSAVPNLAAPGLASGFHDVEASK
ncbi:hypothetical protein BDV95DRAFT_583828 [Massariosphaeria phaeospora]|uniref:Secreted protein n=1 Tax=Massariosphaeria phaeospora TaxID=100035 RepID=A0A7C8HZZ5_9PLEO|nr:hypothetical protein BDV95DRAFT_583828 [Massariosphaeria phaeospora]